MRSFHYGLWEHELFPACLNPSNCYSYFFLFFFKIYLFTWASLIAQLVKNPPAVREPRAWSLGWEDPLEKGKATDSSVPAWRTPRTAQPTGSPRVRTGRLRLRAGSFVYLTVAVLGLRGGPRPFSVTASRVSLRLHGPGVSPQWPVLLQSVGFNSCFAGPSCWGAQVCVGYPQSVAWAHIPCAGR